MRRLLVLMHALPHDARSVRADPDDQPWGMTEELLAQLLEITSVYASERRIAEPVQVPRPWDDLVEDRRPARRRRPTKASEDRPQPVRRGRGDTTPVAGTTVGLGAATVEMAAWAARNGGAGGNGAAALGFGPPAAKGGES